MRINEMTEEQRKAHYRAHNLKFRTDHPNYHREYYEANRERILERAKLRYRNMTLGRCE